MRADPWDGWEQPTLISAEVPEDEWEAGRVPVEPLELTDDVHSPAELVAAGGCSPQCLASSDHHDNHCSCRCSGQYHGILAHVDLRQVLMTRGSP